MYPLAQGGPWIVVWARSSACGGCVQGQGREA